MFRFSNIPGQPAYSRNIAVAGRSLLLANWTTLPLKKGRTYMVQVRASFDNGATYCNYGTSCNIRIANTPAMEPRTIGSWSEDDGSLFSIYPNPSLDGGFNIALNAYDEEEPMFVEIFDATGVRVAKLEAGETVSAVAPVLEADSEPGEDS